MDDFQALSEPERLQLLLEFSEGLPELPARLKDHPELLEQVVECQSPLFLTIETEKPAITPLRMRGMTAMLGRINRKVASAPGVRS